MSLHQGASIAKSAPGAPEKPYRPRPISAFFAVRIHHLHLIEKRRVRSAAFIKRRRSRSARHEDALDHDAVQVLLRIGHGAEAANEGNRAVPGIRIRNGCAGAAQGLFDDAVENALRQRLDRRMTFCSSRSLENRRHPLADRKSHPIAASTNRCQSNCLPDLNKSGWVR
jgi:hypothetical protein